MRQHSRIPAKSGLTIVELIVAMVISAIVMLGIGFIVADSQRQWNVMYNRAYSDVAIDTYVATKTFDALVRKADGQKFTLSENHDWVEIYYPADTNTVAADRYARFSYLADTNDLGIEYGRLNPGKEALDTETICQNVSACVFEVSGRSVQMILTLNDGSQTATVVSSAYMNNQ